MNRTKYTLKRTDGTMVTTYRVDAASIQETADGSWMAWAVMVARTGKAPQDVIGGIHVRGYSRHTLEAKLRSGVI